GGSGVGKTSVRVTLPHSNSKLISGKRRNISNPKLTVGLPRAYQDATSRLFGAVNSQICRRPSPAPSARARRSSHNRCASVALSITSTTGTIVLKVGRPSGAKARYQMPLSDSLFDIWLFLVGAPGCRIGWHPPFFDASFWRNALPDAIILRD